MVASGVVLGAIALGGSFSLHSTFKFDNLIEILYYRDIMDLKFFNLVIFSGVYVSSFAAPIDLLNTSSKNLRPVGALFSGASWINSPNQSVLLAGTDEELFTYYAPKSAVANDFIGGFVGVEKALSVQGLLLQIGVEYDNFQMVKVQGNSLAGVQDDTSTLYLYRVHLKRQQVMGSAKLLGTLQLPKLRFNPLHPYFNLALGSAFNKANSFTTYPDRGTCTLNLTPTFADNSTTQFSYNIGLGVDMDITSQVRLGLGYRYSNFGHSSLGAGIVRVGQYTASIDSSVRFNTVSTNQLLAQLTYIA